MRKSLVRLRFVELLEKYEINISPRFVMRISNGEPKFFVFVLIGYLNIITALCLLLGLETEDQKLIHSALEGDD